MKVSCHRDPGSRIAELSRRQAGCSRQDVSLSVRQPRGRESPASPGGRISRSALCARQESRAEGGYQDPELILRGIATSYGRLIALFFALELFINAIEHLPDAVGLIDRIDEQLKGEK